MSFSNEWERIYRDNGQLSVWPWSDLVSYVYRYARPASKEFRVLELGCGAGANIPLFRSFGVKYHAIEGSETIVARLRERFPEYADTIVPGDFTEAFPFEAGFDLILDRAAVTHNSTAAIRRCLDEAHAKLKPGGTYIGIDWFSTEHSDMALGLPDGDAHTRNGFPSGQFAGVGRVHFSDRPHLEDLFRRFSLIALEHTTARTHVPAGGPLLACWNIAARKA